MSVKIEMAIPKSCNECRFCIWSSYKKRWMCTVADLYVRYMTEQKCHSVGRRTYCPLQEVKE